ncbi:ring-1,2-phenylacetyl-CoA epoxidase subunit PaaC [Streptomyces sp. SAI-144]|uniref:1,2-phenylacetyl-CoA epoxidase subunit PaaC n=1 Tax=Streptomyces sp. SAI-144 TaxID=2940544 RepID=UPI002475C717|nr:1,2-phenylacetyl-CoA epoxidase subunit PaaC [Streptomyces sp. SAI-144]MDH6437562.1 ring-1,2-phenylacetyl-CoA epoxidase subunit PaaC [Streptomyces sp. SAI-144]
MTDEDLYVDGDGARWAFGTGFTDPLHGIDQAVPDGVDAADLAACCLALGDDALVSAQRLAEWCTRAPELEEELALANIGLDLLGQARLLYARAGRADGTGRGEDAYAYFRAPVDFRNIRLAELPGGDFAFTVARLLVLSVWRLAVCEALTTAPDPVLGAIAAKSVKELAYHRRWAAEWTVRLGDGTDESAARMQAALDELGPWLDELLSDGTAARQGAEPAAVAARTRLELFHVLADAGLNRSVGVSPLDAPASPVPGSGRNGQHTPHLAPLLAELQSVARAHPDASW